MEPVNVYCERMLTDRDPQSHSHWEVQKIDQEDSFVSVAEVVAAVFAAAVAVAIAAYFVDVHWLAESPGKLALSCSLSSSIEPSRDPFQIALTQELTSCSDSRKPLTGRNPLETCPLYHLVVTTRRDLSANL